MTGPSLFRSTLLGALIAVLCALPGCGEDDTDTDAPDDKASRLEKIAEEAAANAGDALERSAIEARDPSAENVLEFDRIEITPTEASVKTETISVQAFLKPGASAFTDVTFKWTVEGRELVGYEVSRLNRNEGRWKALDWITVQAMAVDEQGREALSKPVAVQIANGTPQIITSLATSRFLHGKVLEATDPDGDPISWSLEGDAPGFSITDSGMIRVKEVQLDEPFSGEVVFVAQDPHGARAELHLPVSINAAVAARTEDAGVAVRQADVRELTDDELLEQADADAKRVEGLSPEELNKLLREREAAGKQ